MTAPRSRLACLLFVPLWLSFLAGCSPAKTSAPKLYHMGERAEAGPIVYTVLEAEWHNQLGQADDPRFPRDNFLLIRLSVTNGGSEECTVPPLHLVDSRGASHRELQEGEGVPEWLGMLRRLQPAETRHGRVVFDVPRADYRLQVTDDAFLEDEMETAWIEVPLRFASSPGVAPPGVR